MDGKRRVQGYASPQQRTRPANRKPEGGKAQTPTGGDEIWYWDLLNDHIIDVCIDGIFCSHGGKLALRRSAWPCNTTAADQKNAAPK
jgi:hypothetical protein